MAFDPRTGKEVFSTPVPYLTQVVTASAVSRLMAIGLSDGELRVLDLDTGSLRFTHKFPTSYVWHVSFNKEGTRLYACTMNKVGAVFEVKQKSLRLLRILDGFWGYAVSDDNRFVLGRFHPPVLFDTAKLETPDFRFDIGELVSLYLPRRQSFALIPYKVGSQIKWHRLQLDGPPVPQFAVNTGLKEREVFTEYGMGTARLTRPPQTSEIIDVVTGKKIATIDDPKLILRTYIPITPTTGIGSHDFTGYTYLIDTRGEQTLLDNSNSNPLDRSPDGRELAIGTDQGKLIFLDTSTLEKRSFLISRFTLNDAEFSKDGKWIAVAHDPHSAGIFSVATGEARVRFQGHSSNVLGISWSPDEKRIATGGRDNTVRIWDADSGRMLSILRGHQAAVRHVRFLPDGVHLVSVDTDGVLLRWSAPRAN